MNQETARIDTQAHRIVDQREAHKCQQQRQHQQYDINATQIGVHIIHQILLIGHICHLRIPPQFTDNPSERVTVGIVRLQLQFERGHKGIGTKEFRRVGAHRLSLLLQGLLLAHVVDILREGPMVQITAQALGIVHADVITQHHGHRQVLLHPRGQIDGCQHREYDKPQQYQHHRCTDTQCDHLHTPVATRLIAIRTH